MAETTTTTTTGTDDAVTADGLPPGPTLATRGKAAHTARVVTLIIVGIGAIVFSSALAYAISSALKPPGEVLATPLQWIPSEFRWDNFLEPFRQTSFARYFFNSAFVGISVTLLNLLTCTLAGYSFAKFSYPGRGVLFAIVIATLMVPIEIIYVPLFDLVDSLGWVNTYWGLIIPYGTNAFGIFLMRQSMISVPQDFIEAARVDGAGELRILFQIVLPMIKAPLAALGLFIFMTNWDALLWPLLVAAESSYHTLPVGLAAMQASYATSFTMLMAAALIAMLPTLVLFITLQRHFVAGLTLSAGVNK